MKDIVIKLPQSYWLVLIDDVQYLLSRHLTCEFYGHLRRKEEDVEEDKKKKVLTTNNTK